MQVWFCPLLAFLMGSIPFGLWIARIKGVDIRAHGSGNIGATNVYRIIGKKQGLLCLFLDLLKGFVPVVVVLNLIQLEGRSPGIGLGFLDSLALVLPATEQFKVQGLHVLCALAAVLGHNYSPWIGFRGGKGIATSAGVVLALMPFALILLAVVFGVVLAATRYVSLASMAGAVALPILTHVGARFHKNAEGMSLWEAGTWNRPLFFFSLLIAVLAVWKHRSNFVRIMNGTENRIEFGNKKEAPEA